ncbi:MAG TPA: antibiotic biosynthesis monooxygenase family protein [Syntrophales bacterium]|nr:antibiotic biosynthesis monooxygenase family protein [Syntrophales bacterium]
MTITIEVRAQPGKVKELYQTLQALIPTMRKEVGCQACRVSRDVEEGDLFFLSCEWDAPGSLDDYMRSGSGSALLGAIDLLGESARFKAGSDESWKEIEALRRVRKANG